MKRPAFLLIGTTLLLVMLACAAKPRLQVNILALDLLHRTLAGKTLLEESNAADRALQLGRMGDGLGRRVAAMWFCENGKRKYCKELYKEVVQDNADTLAAFHLANLLATEDREEEAVTLWRLSGSGRYWAYQAALGSGCVCQSESDSMCYLERAATVNPDDATIQYLLGNRFHACAEWEKAYPALTKALHSGELTENIAFKAYMERAEASFGAGKGLDQTIDDLEKAIGLQPENPWPYLRMCSFYQQESYLQEAQLACEQGLRWGPELSFAYYYRGRVWESMEEMDAAVADYHQALILDPGLDSARVRLEQIGK